MDDPRGELLLLVPTASYRLDDFRAATRRLEVPLVVGSDRCHKIEDFYGEEPDLLSLDYRRPSRAAEQIAEAARSRPIRGIVPTSDPTAVIAALAAERLGLPHNPPDAARRAANKHAMRVALRSAGVPVPDFHLFSLDDDLEAAAPRHCVPVRAEAAHLLGEPRRHPRRRSGRLRRRLAAHRAAPPRHRRRAASTRGGRRGRGPGRGLRPRRGGGASRGSCAAGGSRCSRCSTSRIPLDGPFFEETIYVTPSRHPPDVLGAIEAAAAAGARALGLVEGPVHAELRLPPSGPVVLEVAARSIGGLCSRTLRFGAGLTLEEVLVAHAMGLPLEGIRREARASGVMMLPIPRRGVLHGVRGVEAARDVPGVEDVVITVPEGREVVPLPEGDSYLGFLFAKGESPAAVEASLREAHRRLAFEIRPALPTV